MNKEKDFFKTCFNIVVELEVKNESQAIAKEVVLREIENLEQENKKLNGAIQTYDILLKANVEENKQLKDKLSKIETLIINHNCDTGDIYYKYNSKFLKSELKQRILETVYEVSE